MVKKQKKSKIGKDEEIDNYEISSLVSSYEPPYTSADVIELAKILDAKVKDPQQIHPINANYENISKNLSGINLLFGAAFTGRKSSIYYGNKNAGHPIFSIDANIYSTENQFIEKLVTEFSDAVGVEDFGKKLVLDDQITFHNMSKMIQNKKIKIVIIVDNAEKLVEPKRQTILYTMLEWYKEPATKDYVALYFVAKNTKFTEQLQKRVKSRMTANYLFYHNPDVDSMIKIVQCRFSSASIHYGLQQKIIQCLQYVKTVNKMKQYHQMGKSIGFFLSWIKCTLCGLDLKQFKVNHLQYFYEVLQNSLNWMSPHVGINLLLNASFPQLTFVAIVSNMIKNSNPTLNLDQVIKQYIKIKQRLLSGPAIGSSFNYSQIIMQRAFKKLIDMRILSVDDTLQAFRFAPITFTLNREQTEIELLNIPKLPSVIKKILQEY